MKNKLDKEIVADWCFNINSVKSGAVNNGNLIINDNSNNNNLLEMVNVGKVKDFTKYLKWGENNNCLKFNNSVRNGEGIYFETNSEAMINSLDFKSGFTIEVLVDLPKKHDAWMGILTRQGCGKELGKKNGEIEILTTLSYNSEFQWTGYPLNLDYNPTNWSISATNDKSRGGFHHVAIVNDGENTTLYLNGITDIRNPKEKISGIEFVEGKGWQVGAAMWDNKLSSLFTGKLKRIRIASTALPKEAWIVQEAKQSPTINLKGTNNEKKLLNRKENYNFAVIPDSQYMGQSKPQMLTEINKWFASNKKDLNIKMVMHVGDITEESSIEELENADKYFELLDKVNCNYMTTPGNHDYKDGAINFSKYFGKKRYENKKNYKENSFNNLNMYSTVNAGNYEYLFISLDYKNIEEGVEWAKSIIEVNKDKPTIIFTHDCYDDINNEIKRTLNGEFIWKNLISNENSIFMVIAGHEFGVKHKLSKNNNNENVIEMLVNYQMYPSGGNGWIRMIEIDEDYSIRCKTISPWVKSIPLNNRTAYDLLHLTSDDDDFCINFSIKDRFRKS